MKKLHKNLLHLFIILLCLTSLSTSFAQLPKCPTTTKLETTDDIDNKTEITETTIHCWRLFEQNVKGKLGDLNNVYYQVYLDVNGKTIIADYLVLNPSNGKYKIIDAKASEITDLLSLTSTQFKSKLTTNQSTIYPTINTGGVTAKVITTRNSLIGGILLNSFSTTAKLISIETGVQFYVNSPKGQYTIALPKSL